ncbi:hypothetical protein WN55_03427 [Dufourea novaeangliae]|uniref:Uncharacterized protein n=1 Tax=Dufourea novaeangliae TaxID=178035 RepID=A0A154PJD7_DUFNO|nr:hypothetical protein WN55_03427 [Dufourea novaeangliae]
MRGAITRAKTTVVQRKKRTRDTRNLGSPSGRRMPAKMEVIRPADSIDSNNNDLRGEKCYSRAYKPSLHFLVQHGRRRGIFRSVYEGKKRE